MSLVDSNVDKHHTRDVATAYLNFLYTKPGPGDRSGELLSSPRRRRAPAHAADFPKITLYDFSDVFGDWQKAQATFFADKGVFDQIYKPGQ